MTTKILDKNISEIRDEVELLRSAVIGFIGEDEEGEYRPEFVREILKLAKEKPKYEFKSSKSFLVHIRKNK